MTEHPDRQETAPAPECQDSVIEQQEDRETPPYCTGDRCGDCEAPGPDDPYGETDCCEATCGCCPRVNAHGNCRLAPGSEDNSRYCDQHGEGWLFDRSPEAEQRYQILRNA